MTTSPPRLIVINGLPCAGKSSMAQHFVREHPLSLALDIDAVRALLGWGTVQQLHDAGIAARRLAVAMARTHLTTGHDVVVPQYLGRVDFLVELEQLGHDVGATFVEVALRVAPLTEAVERFAARSAAAASQTHRDAAVGLPEGGSLAEFESMQADLDTVLATRPATIIVDSVPNNPDATWHALAAHIG